MNDTPPVPTHPRWDGADISWVTPHDSVTPPSNDIERGGRTYPLQDLLRALGRELDDLDEGSAIFKESAFGFTASGQIGGRFVRREYSHAELAARADQWRKLRSQRVGG